VGSVVVLGERSRVTGFALAGARVAPAEDARTVLAAWQALEDDVAVVVLTPAAAIALGALLDEPPRPGRPLTVVMPGTGGSGPTPSAAEASG
jgi:vacuolar-type H+-ATPase subunit F/Vma7